MTVLGNKTLKPVGDAQNGGHVVGVEGLHHNGADDIVDAGAKPAAGHDGALGSGGVEVEFFARASGLEADAEGRVHFFRQFFIHNNLHGLVVCPGAVGQHRIKLAGAKRADFRLQRTFLHGAASAVLELFA